jgi:calcineurin-like phosphoesterase family protein
MRSDQIYFTSDTHFGHKAMVERFGRPFSSIDEMDEELIRRWNEVVPQNGHIFHLGDVSFRKQAETAAILARLNGVKYLIEGNHDHLNRLAYNHFQWAKDYYELKVEDTGDRLVLCHYAFQVWNRSHYGAWHLHGHSHGNLAPIGRRLDVGSDTHEWRPYTFAEVAEIMGTREFAAHDHHY